MSGWRIEDDVGAPESDVEVALLEEVLRAAETKGSGVSRGRQQAVLRYAANILGVEVDRMLEELE